MTEGGRVKSEKKGVKVVMDVRSDSPTPFSGWAHTALPTHLVMVSGSSRFCSLTPLALEQHRKLTRRKERLIKGTEEKMQGWRTRGKRKREKRVGG